VIWLVTTINRANKSTAKVDTQKEEVIQKRTDILPSPRKFQGLFGSSSTSRATPRIVSANDFSAFAFSTSTSFNTYSSPVFQTQGSQFNTNQNTQATALQDSGVSRAMLVRNLSIYEGGHVYTGLSFVGEARDTMFRDGKFLIVVVDSLGKVVGASYAVAQNTLAPVGWKRFETRIMYTLPNKVPCTMIFEESLSPGEQARAPSRVAVPITCN
jgi:hypothetical protein